MNRKIILLLVMAFYISAMAHTTSVSIIQPYSPGEISLLPDQDTVSFSNGIRIFSMEFVAPVNTPESGLFYYAIVFQSPSGKFVYKYNPAISLTKPVMPPYVTLEKGAGYFYSATGNNDTNWISANMIPLQTFPSDSLFKGEPDSTICGYNGKILFSCEKSNDIFYPWISGRPFSEYNSIVYFLPSSPGNNAMKIQTTSLKIDTLYVSTPTPNSPSSQVIMTQIKIRWAIDSLGNGVFKSTTGLSSPPRSGSRPVIKEKRKEVIINKAIHDNEPQERNSGYIANGRLLKQNSRQVLPCGVLVMKRDLLR